MRVRVKVRVKVKVRVRVRGRVGVRDGVRGRGSPLRQAYGRRGRGVISSGRG